MSVSVEVPPLGDSVTEAIIGELNKQPGEYIEQDEILASLETDKVSVDIPAPMSGVIKELKVNVDDTVGEGDVIAIIEPGEKAAGASEEGGSDASLSKQESGRGITAGQGPYRKGSPPHPWPLSRGRGEGLVGVLNLASRLTAPAV